MTWIATDKPDCYECAECAQLLVNFRDPLARAFHNCYPERRRERKLRRWRQSFGAGTHLKKLLAERGYKHTPTCQCETRERKMNESGPGWCRKHLPAIIVWLREEANAQGVRFFAPAARWIVGKAIRLAERDAATHRPPIDC